MPMRRIPDRTEVVVVMGGARLRYRITSFVSGDEKRWPLYRATSLDNGRRRTIRADIADSQNPHLLQDVD